MQLVSEMSDRPALEGQEIVYGAEIVTGGDAGEPDTVVLVTEDEILASPIAGKEAESTLQFTVDLDDLVRIECGGFLADAVPIETTTGTYEIPTRGLDTIRFITAVVHNSRLTNGYEHLGFGTTKFAVCKWTACLGGALILIGIALSITMIDVLGLPLLVLGSAMLVGGFAYKKIGDYLGDYVWTLPEVDATTA